MEEIEYADGERENVEIKNTKPWYEKYMSLEDARTFIKANITTAARSFIAIGFYLKCIRDRELFKEENYSDVWEFARSEYGISKSTASRYMSMNDRFSENGNSPNIRQEYQAFGKSQLQEMLYLDSEQLEKVKPEDRVEDIRNMRRTKEIPYIELPGQMEFEVDFPEVFPEQQISVREQKDQEEQVFELHVEDFMMDQREEMEGAVAVSQQEEAAYVKEQYRLQKSFLYPFVVWLIKNHKNWFLADYTNRVLRVDQSVPQLKAYLDAGQSGFRSFGFPANDDTYYAKMYDKGIEISHFTDTGDTVIDGISEWFYLAAGIQSMWNEVALEAVQEETGLSDSAEKVVHESYSCAASQEESTDKAEKPLVLSVKRGCIRGLSPYGSCVCCGLGETECCSQCKEQDSCNSVCGWLNKATAAKTEAEEIIINTEFKEVPQEERLTPEYFLELEKGRLERLLRASEGAELKQGDIKVIERQKTVVAALASMVCDLQMSELKKQIESEKSKQPELPVLKNNDQRAVFIDAYETWPVWIETEKTGERYYRYDLPDSTSIVVKVYHSMLFDHKKAAVKWEDCFTEGYGKNEYYLLEKGKFFKDSETNRSALIEKLKEIQKKGTGER